jgi:ABC-type multidrug transport system fused ATPase/permease subunit
LKDIVFSFPSQLNYIIDPSSGDFSVGQLQLFSIARVILLKPNLLVMDEATSSLDLENETLILNLVSTLLPRCTVISIAHRISAVMLMHRVAVMDRGTIVEVGPPAELLAQPDSHFASLARSCN